MTGIVEDENDSEGDEDDDDGIHCEGSERRSGSKGELQGEE